MKFAKLFCLFAGTVTMAGCDDASYKPASDAGRFDFNLYAQTTGNSASVCAVSAFPVDSYSITLNGVASNGQCVSATYAESGVYTAQATLKYNGESLTKSISVNVQSASGTFVARKPAYGPILEPQASLGSSSSDGVLSMESMFGDSGDAASSEESKTEEQPKVQDDKKQTEPKAADKPAEESKKPAAAPQSDGGHSMPVVLQNGKFDEETPDASKTAEKQDAADDKKEAVNSSDKSGDTEAKQEENTPEGTEAKADDAKDAGSDVKQAETNNASKIEEESEKGPGTALTKGDGCYFSSTVNGWGFEKMLEDPETGLFSIAVAFSGSGDEKGPQRFKITDATDWNHRILGQSYVAPDRMCDIPSTCPDIEFKESGNFKLVVNMKDMTWSLQGEDGKTYPVITDEISERLERIKKIAEDSEKYASDALLSHGGESAQIEKVDGEAQQVSSSDADSKVSDSTSEQKSDEGAVGDKKEESASADEKKDESATSEDKKDESASADEKKDESAPAEDNKDENAGGDDASGGDDGGSSDDEDIGLDSLSW